MKPSRKFIQPPLPRRKEGRALVVRTAPGSAGQPQHAMVERVAEKLVDDGGQARKAVDQAERGRHVEHRIDCVAAAQRVRPELQRHPRAEGTRHRRGRPLRPRPARTGR
jgi:hypothetical protein